MKLQLTHSDHPDVMAGLSLLLVLTGGTALLILGMGSLRFVTYPATQIDPASPTIAQPVIPNLETSRARPILKSESLVYMLQAKGNRIEMVPIVAISRSPQESEATILTETLNSLLANPKLASLGSSIPPGTRLLNLQIKPEGIHLNLSHEFTHGGGSASMTYRVAQVLYTATSLEPRAKVYLSVEGKLLDEDNPLGGEGIILQQPMTRQQFIKDLLTKE